MAFRCKTGQQRRRAVFESLQTVQSRFRALHTGVIQEAKAEVDAMDALKRMADAAMGGAVKSQKTKAPEVGRRLDVNAILGECYKGCCFQEGVIRALAMPIAEYAHLMILLDSDKDGKTLPETTKGEGEEYIPGDLKYWNRIIYPIREHLRYFEASLSGAETDHQSILKLCGEFLDVLKSDSGSIGRLREFLWDYLEKRGLPLDTAPSPFGRWNRMKIYEEYLCRGDPHIRSVAFDKTILCTVNGGYPIGSVMYTDHYHPSCYDVRGMTGENVCGPFARIEAITACAFYTTARYENPTQFPSVGDALLEYARSAAAAHGDRKLHVEPLSDAESWRAKLAGKPYVVMAPRNYTPDPFN